MKVPEEIVMIIKQIEVLEATAKKLYSELSEWFKKNNIDVLKENQNMITNLRNGIGAEELIKWLENKEE